MSARVAVLGCEQAPGSSALAPYGATRECLFAGAVSLAGFVSDHRGHNRRGRRRCERAGEEFPQFDAAGLHPFFVCFAWRS
jgi:hypothetical protein